MQIDNILVSSARSGTNYFLSVFQKICPDAWVAKEIFRQGGDSLALQVALLGGNENDLLDSVKDDPLLHWQNIVSSCAAENRVALAKVFYYHQPKSSPLWAHFRNNSKVIHLIRRNQFDVFVSNLIAQQTGKWQQFGLNEKGIDIKPIHIDKNSFTAFLENQQMYIEWMRALFVNADYTEVFYEDLASSTEICARSIADIYGLKTNISDISIELTKQKTRSNADLVSNYADVMEMDRKYF
ncbi:sulfotransferase domain-containing protein [Roseibium sp.]|uniref:sulfotransferase domain-containing protein n=1 Tax=Roseibium sp. TaxID=1936156 RepID=UPI003BAC0FA2